MVLNRRSALAQLRCNPYGNSSYPDYFDLRDSGAFEALAAYAHIAMALDATGQTESVAGELVSGNYFDVLGIKVPIGRAFAPDEDRIGMPVHVAVVSHSLLQRTFGGTVSMIGQTIQLNGNPYTLIGVAPPGFAGPMLGVATDVWVPTACNRRYLRLWEGGHRRCTCRGTKSFER